VESRKKLSQQTERASELARSTEEMIKPKKRKIFGDSNMNKTSSEILCWLLNRLEVYSFLLAVFFDA